ncbi:hypothetical protein HED60_02810 [Planctomycetales bacterium ZRK34]|nr:hypothetical protein HED60_02810 [Planctomycetales bacterium ZRK34]
MAAVGSFAASTQAATVYGTSADLTGSRSVTAGELVLAPTDSTQWPNASISWSITESGGVYTYEYTFEGFAGAGRDNKQISHWVLDLTDNAVTDKGELADPNAITNIMVKGDGGYVAYSGPLAFGTGGDNEIDGITGAVKFDAGHELFGSDYNGTLYFKFDSNRAPVWGDVFLKAKDALTNLYFGDSMHVDGDDISGYIARPDGDTPPETPLVPTPASLPAGLLMLGAMLLSRRF